MPGRILSTNATIALSLIVSTLACTSSQTSLTSPTDTKCQVNLSNSPSSFAASGGTGTLTVTTTRDCPWTISTDVVWVSIPGPRDGQGDASISYSVAVNPVPSPRSGLVAAGSVRVQLSQAAAACRFSLSRSSDTIGAAGGQPLRRRVHAHRLQLDCNVREQLDLNHVGTGRQRQWDGGTGGFGQLWCRARRAGERRRSAVHGDPSGAATHRSSAADASANSAPPPRAPPPHPPLHRRLHRYRCTSKAAPRPWSGDAPLCSSS